MSGYRGYRNYRGRGSKGKAILSVILVLIIIASIVFIFLQKYVIYDETGTPHLALPQRAPVTETPQENEELKLTIQEAAKAAPLKGVVFPVPLDRESWSLSRRQTGEILGETFNCDVLTLKDHQGKVYFDSAAALPGAVQFYEEDTDVVLDAALNNANHTVVRLSCFLDPYAALHDARGMGLLKTDGYLFRDEAGAYWTDPGREEVRQYLCAMAQELAGMGFDEILLTDVTYPTTGELDSINYVETMKTQNIIAFLEEMGQALAEHDVVLSIQLPAEVILEGSDNLAGLMLADILPRVDRVYAVTTEEQAGELTEKLAAKKMDFLPILPTDNRWEGGCLITAQ